MNVSALLKPLTKVGSKVLFKIQKRLPEIMIASGIIGIGVSTVMACKATVKAPEKIHQAKEEIDIIHSKLANQTLIEDGVYSQRQGNKDLAGVYWRSVKDMIKLYYPSAILGAVSVASILGSHTIMKRRNADLIMACATLDDAFKTYRKNVVAKYGEEEDKNLRHSLQEKIVDTVVTDAEGNEKTVKETVKTPTDDYLKDIRRLTWDETTSDLWSRITNYNFTHLRSACNEATDILRAKGHLYLYELYELLGIKSDSGYYSKDAYKYGWVIKAGEHRYDRFVDFGIDFDKLLIDITEEMNSGIIRQDHGYYLEFNIEPYPIISSMNIPEHPTHTKGALTENGRIVCSTEE